MLSPTYLQPTHFDELDAMARSLSGSVLVVKEGLVDCIARIGAMVEGAYIDATIRDAPGCIAEVSAIHVANRIHMAEIAEWRRPRLHYGAIPSEDIFKFAVLHEVGHILGDFDRWATLALTKQEQWRVHILNEANADAFAWKKLYGRKPMPENPHGVVPIRRLQDWRRAALRCLGKPAWKPTPLPIGPGVLIPCEHARRGIPFLAAS